MRAWGDGDREGFGQPASREEKHPHRRRGRRIGFGAAGPALLCLIVPTMAAAAPAEPLYVAGIPVDFILFALTLLGVALFHHHTLQVALTGLAAITLYKLGFTGFKDRPGLAGPRACTCSTSG